MSANNSMSNTTTSDDSRNASSLNTSHNNNNNKNLPVIPMSRVKTIMKSSPEIHTIQPDVLYVVSKATEQFIVTFVKEAYKKSNKDVNLDYKKLANLVAKDDKFQFLSEIIPQKVKASEALKLIEADKHK